MSLNTTFSYQNDFLMKLKPCLILCKKLDLILVSPLKRKAAVK